MKVKTMKELQGMLATFVENGCCIRLENKIIKLQNWLQDHNYIPIGKIKLKHGLDEKRHEELDAYGDLFREFDANYDEPFNRLLWIFIYQEAKEINWQTPIMLGFTPYESDEMEIRLEF